MKRREFIALAGGAAASSMAWPLAAGAQSVEYPTRTVRIVIGFGAGGGTDTVARIVAQKLQEELGGAFLIENKPGGGGRLAPDTVAKSTPDGYTLLGAVAGAMTVGTAIWPNIPYDIFKDFVPISMMADYPLVVIVNKDHPAHSIAELVAWLKANPDKATEGTAGLGSGQHISGVYFQKITGVKFQFVPYKSGSSDIIRDITAGHIDFTFDQAITSLSHIKSGNVRALAVTSNQRLEAAPEIPTVDEAGAPGIYISTWYGLWLPKGSPQEAIDKLGAAARTALADPALRARLSSLGQQIPPPEQQTAAALAAYTKAEIDKWHAIIKEAGIKAE